MKIITSLASAAALLAVTAFVPNHSHRATTLSRPATVKGTTGTRQTNTAADVATAANAFIATLSSTQRTTLLQGLTSTNVTKWSNLPCGSQCRIGLQLSSLTTAQVTAALAVVAAATGTEANQGYQEIQQIRAADDYLAANTTSGYGSGIYFIAFLVTNTSATTIGASDSWMLQFGGHHLATNITFKDGNVTGPSPKFEGVEPLSFTSTGGIFPSGTVVAPLNDEQTGMVNLFASLTADQKTAAKLSQTFNDVLLGPGADAQFPTSTANRGLLCSQLTTAQQNLVVAALAPWVKDVDDATGTQLLSYYRTQLANTYIAYSGTGNFTSNADYARIDGPNAWVEFICQTGVVFRTQIHYHSIYRDRARDYGGNFYTTVTGVREQQAAAVFGLYPSPVLTGGDLQLRLTVGTGAATYTVRNVLGQRVASGAFVNGAAALPTTNLTAGTYLLTVERPGLTAVTSRFQVQ